MTPDAAAERRAREIVALLVEQGWITRAVTELFGETGGPPATVIAAALTVATAAGRRAGLEEAARVADAATGGDNLLHSCADNHLTDFAHGVLHGQAVRYAIAAGIRALLATSDPHAAP